VPNDKPVNDLQTASRDDEKGSDGNNTSTESDETAHVRSRDDITVDDETATIAAGPAEEKGALLIGHVSLMFCHYSDDSNCRVRITQPIPLAVSVAVIAIAGWAYVNRIKE
jgi:hypothetical protein